MDNGGSWAAILAEIESAAAGRRRLIEAQLVLRPGATAGELDAMERRLGGAVCPTYTALLSETNGLDFIGPSWGALDASTECEWFARANPNEVASFHESPFGPASPADTPGYFDYGTLGNPETCLYHLESCLRITRDLDGHCLLLNPKVRDKAGQWEAWWFSPSLCIRFQNLIGAVRRDNGLVTAQRRS